MGSNSSQTWEGVKGVSGDRQVVDSIGRVETVNCRHSSEALQGEEVVVGENSSSHEFRGSSQRQSCHGRHHQGLRQQT